MTVQEAIDAGFAAHLAGRVAEAEAIYRQVLAAQPNHPVALHLLGLIAYQAGRPADAAELIARAIAIQPNIPEFHTNLAMAQQAMGKMELAAESCRAALRLRPDDAVGKNNLGAILGKLGRSQEALQEFVGAVGLQPDYAEAYGNMASALREMRRIDEAIDACYQSLALRPHHADAYLTLANLAISLSDLVCYDDAVEMVTGKRPTRAVQSAVPQRTLDNAVASRRIYSAGFCPLFDAPLILHEAREFDRQFAQPLMQSIQPHDNERDPERPLRIGYVSADFNEHRQATCMVPLLANHDREEFEIHCYSADAGPDEQLAGKVRADRIDILVDLSLHSPGNRLLLFARKPAPVQMTWLAYPGTTGVKTIDYRLSDPHLDPPALNPLLRYSGGGLGWGSSVEGVGQPPPFPSPGVPGEGKSDGAQENALALEPVAESDADYSERTLRLPDSFYCYDPLRDLPPPGPLPAETAGHVTFGCLNDFKTVSEAALRSWKKVLQAVAGSRLILAAPPGAARQFVLQKLPAERVEFVDPPVGLQAVELYRRIDIGLDTLPFNGMGQSLESFWMGVPVVTRIGRTAVGRMGWSHLCNLGLKELAATTPENFAQVALELAGNLRYLSDLRRTLRDRMKQSPLMDAGRFARGIESVYRQAWRQWCRDIA